MRMSVIRLPFALWVGRTFFRDHRKQFAADYPDQHSNHDPGQRNHCWPPSSSVSELSSDMEQASALSRRISRKLSVINTCTLLFSLLVATIPPHPQPPIHP